MKKKMDFMTKAKLIYSGELAIFAVAFLVIAILEFTQVMKINGTLFNWITIFGGTWLFIDFFWAKFSKKRQKRVALIDKIIVLPLGLYLIAFDLYCFIAQPEKTIYRYGIPVVLLYLAIVYTFEAIYHFKYPVPGLIEAEEQAKQAEAEAANQDNANEEIVNQEEKKEEENVQ